MAYEGHIDTVNDRSIAGWVYDNARPDDAIPVEVLAGDAVIASFPANQYRPDLVRSGKGNGWHGFSHTLASAAPEPLSVRVAGKRWRIQPTRGATGQTPPLHSDPRRRYLHTLEYGYPRVETSFIAATPAPDEARIVARLLDAFHRAMNDDPARGVKKDDAWIDIEISWHGPLLKILRERNAAALAEYLRDAHAQGLTYGITQGPDMTNYLRSGEHHRRWIATEYADNLASFAEYIGVLDVESPFQAGQWGENIHADPQALSDAIEKAVGIAVEAPNVIGSYFGLRTRAGVITQRDLAGLYAALQVRGLARDLGIASPRICEIGGGMGGVAYYGARLGMDFTIIDLPLVGILQGYFLLRALPQAAIQLYGEPDTGKTGVRLMPTFCFQSQDVRYDLLLNQDSFPEMNAEYSLAYLRRARDNVRHAFYSINQEARGPQSYLERQTTVPDLVEQAGGFRRTSRHRHWLRPGYVEEVYRKA